MHFWKIIGSIIKFSWRAINLVREIIANLLFLFIILAIWGLWVSLKDQDSQNSYPQKGVLEVNIQGSIVDTTPYDEDYYRLRAKIYGAQIDRSRENSLFELTEKIAQAANDPNITGMILKLDDFTGADLPSLQYIGKYLNQFSENNKPIYAVSPSYNQNQYYLASFADHIYLTPQGAVSLYGFGTNTLYYKSLLDHLKIDTHVFRVGTYKSAIEPLIRNDMSSEARENTTRWLTTMWHNYLNDVSLNREQLPAVLVPDANRFITDLKAVNGSLSDYALQHNLADKAVPYYQFEADMQAAFKDEPQLSIYNYTLLKPAKNSQTEPNIAVVFVNGTIIDGDASNNNASSYSITQQLKEIRQNDNIRAVIIRVNSPGGSVTASEAIRNEIAALRKKGVPVVISMGGMAASGGYWIATESDYIVASPNTITGSIGIFGVIPTFEQSLAQIGVYTDGVNTSPLVDTSLTKALPTEYSQLMQLSIENGYQTFIHLVANARHLTEAEVDKIAQGQVWLGQEAYQLKLVDQLGDFDDAVAKASELAQLSHYQLDWLKPTGNWFSSLLLNFSASLPQSMADMIYQALPMSKQLQQQAALWYHLNDPQNRYIYCLNCADVR
ncbi:signal peptide peptidase SppA [Utexia brackfieldae]|uniref:signal peptide peptidase SppA n=1 Tax=Utexia brackfieldae TaxID=3074108 RepID=UPI00370D7136